MKKSFSQIMDLIDHNDNITEIRWDDNQGSPYFNLKNASEAQVYQFWFDNAKSSQLKYEIAKQYGVRGLGPFTFSDLYYTFSAEETQRAKEMWSAFDVFYL